VDLSDPEVFARVTQEQLRLNALEVTTGMTIPLLSPVNVLVMAPNQLNFKLTGRAVATYPDGGGYFVQLDGSVELETLRAIEVAPPPTQTAPKEPVEEEPDLTGPEESGDAESDEDDVSEATSPTRAAPTPAWKLIDTTSTVPIHKQLRELGVSDRVRLARQATRPVRLLLLRDIEKRIHLEVVKNPKVTDDEIVEATKITSLSPGALRYIATQRKYIRRRDIVMNLIFNPSTPSDQGMKLVSILNQSELFKVMRSSRVREKLQIAARRKLMKSGVI